MKVCCAGICTKVSISVEIHMDTCEFRYLGRRADGRKMWKKCVISVAHVRIKLQFPPMEESCEEKPERRIFCANSIY